MKREPWRLYDQLIDGIPEELEVRDCILGMEWTMVESDAGCGVALTVRDDSRPAVCSDFHIGRRLKDVAAGVKSWNFREASAGMAAINSFYNTEEKLVTLGIDMSGTGKELTGTGKSVFDDPEEAMKGRRVAVVGHFPKIEKQIGELCELSILERNPRDGDFPDSACEFILPEQDFVYITGMTFINKTLPRLLELSEGAKVSLVGPSSVLHPLLFAHGVDSVSGFFVTDPEMTRHLITHAKHREIFKGGKRVRYNRPDPDAPLV